MRVESDSFWYAVKIGLIFLFRTYMHGKLHETTQGLKIDYLITDVRSWITMNDNSNNIRKLNVRKWTGRVK